MGGQREYEGPSLQELGDGLSAARLRMAVGRLSKRLRASAAADALTPSEVDVLVAAERRGPMRLSDLAADVGLNPTMLSRLIPNLEALGLVRRLRDATDRRVSRISSTDKGHRLLERIRSERTDALSRQLRNLDGAQRAALSEAIPVLEELAERLLQRELTTMNSSR